MDDSLAPQPIVFTPWVDLIRVVAIYLVVIAHVAGQLTNAWGQISTTQWMISNIYGGLARVCVPLFFMLSGYLLLPRSESLHDFYSRRMLKILIPFITWSLIYLGYYCFAPGHSCTPHLIADLLLVKGAYYHLWFLYPLISIYFVLPLLRLMFQPQPDPKLLWYLIVLWLIFEPAIAFANHFWNFRINISAPLATGFPGYFFLGYLLGELKLTRLWINAAAIIWLLATSITIIGTYLFTSQADQFDPFFYDFVTFNVIFASAAAFILLRYLAAKRVFASSTIQASIRWLATRAFGIYLIHVLVMEVLSIWMPLSHLNLFIGDAIFSIPLVGTLVFLLSLLVVTAMQKIPLIQQIVP